MSTVLLMGNKISGQNVPSGGEEMGSARYFRGSSDTSHMVRSVDELWEDCLCLKEGCHILAEAIHDIFEDDESEESIQELETRLQGMTSINQKLVFSLTRDLERHAKLVCSRPENNENLISLVREFVSVINDYMAMLIQNVRKLKRLVSESISISKDTKKSAAKQQPLVYDVISDTLDVDAMLIQLQKTEKRREELERDIITVLVCWRDFSAAVANVEEDPEEVMAAADSVAYGLARLSQ